MSSKKGEFVAIIPVCHVSKEELEKAYFSTD